MGARARHVCPICARDVAPRGGTPQNPSFPFCSPNCKLVDLGRWLDGSYRVSVPDEGGEEAEALAEFRRERANGSDE